MAPTGCVPIVPLFNWDEIGCQDATFSPSASVMPCWHCRPTSLRCSSTTPWPRTIWNTSVIVAKRVVVVQIFVSQCHRVNALSNHRLIVRPIRRSTSRNNKARHWWLSPLFLGQVEAHDDRSASFLYPWIDLDARCGTTNWGRSAFFRPRVHIGPSSNRFVGAWCRGCIRQNSSGSGCAGSMNSIRPEFLGVWT